MDIFSNSRKGFTITELMIAILIMMLVVGGALAIYIMSQTAWYEGSTQIALQRRGSLAMEKMVRGVNGRYGIREGRSGTLTLAGSNRIEVAVDMNDPPTPGDPSDDTTISFYLVDDEIFYDPDTSTAGDEVSIVDDVTSLNFQTLGTTRRVGIDLSLGRRVLGKLINVSLTTNVTLRN